jgi:dUTP pyrophosphatase
MILRYEKIRMGAKSPSRSNPSDAGLDVFYCPEPNARPLMIHPGQTAILETGLKFEVPHGFMLEVKNRSSMASKKQLLVGACVIDPGYSGEVFINLHNVGMKPQIMSAGDKIAQLVLLPVYHFQCQEEPAGTIYDRPLCISNRGEGGFGSTGS